MAQWDDGFGVDQQSHWITSQNRMDILWTHLDAVGSQTVTRVIPNSYTSVIMNTSVLGMITSLIGSPRPNLAGTAGKGQQGAYTAPGAGGCNVAEAVQPSLWGTLKSHGFRFQVKHPPPTGQCRFALRHAARRSPTSKRKPTTGNWMPSWRRRLRPSKERRWRWKPTQRWQRSSPRTLTVSGSTDVRRSWCAPSHRSKTEPGLLAGWGTFLGGDGIRWQLDQLDLCPARNMVCLCIYPLIGESLVMVGGAYPMYHVLTGMFGFVWNRERLIPLVQHHSHHHFIINVPVFWCISHTWTIPVKYRRAPKITSFPEFFSIHKRNWKVKHTCSIRWDDQLNKSAKWRIASLCIQVGISRFYLQLAHFNMPFLTPNQRFLIHPSEVTEEAIKDAMEKAS